VIFDEDGGRWRHGSFEFFLSFFVVFLFSLYFVLYPHEPCLLIPLPVLNFLPLNISLCFLFILFVLCSNGSDLLCGPMVRFPRCRPRGPGFYYRLYQIFWVAVDLERGPLGSCEHIGGAAWNKKKRLYSRKLELTAVGGLRADHEPPLYSQKLALKSAHQWRSLSQHNSLADWKPRSNGPY
jgi:hypothetical protein